MYTPTPIHDSRNCSYWREGVDGEVIPRHCHPAIYTNPLQKGEDAMSKKSGWCARKAGPENTWSDTAAKQHLTWLCNDLLENKGQITDWLILQ